MKAVLINPNSTAAMTASMLREGRRCAPGGVIVEGRTSHNGPASIQGAEDGARASGPLLRLVREVSEAGADGIIIGCFDDTALAASAKVARCPVIGIGQAAFHACALRGWRFSVVTTLAVSVPIIEANIAAYGLAASCSRVRASGVPVLDLEHRPDAAGEKILAEANEAARHDGIDAIVLGCAGMTAITRRLRAGLDLPVVDPIEEAVGCIAWLGQRQLMIA
ncbi:MAG: aspartate/glutamate racemase family protein [Pseudomonadota bacterium]